MPACNRFFGTRIVASPAVLDSLTLPEGVIALRFAPDDLLVLGELGADQLNDPHAIVERESGFAGAWLPAAEAAAFLRHHCEWQPPSEKDYPAFAQGMVAGLPLKLWFEPGRVLFLTPAPLAAELEERMK